MPLSLKDFCIIYIIWLLVNNKRLCSIVTPWYYWAFNVSKVFWKNWKWQPSDLCWYTQVCWWKCSINILWFMREPRQSISFFPCCWICILFLSTRLFLSFTLQLVWFILLFLLLLPSVNQSYLSLNLFVPIYQCLTCPIGPSYQLNTKNKLEYVFSFFWLVLSTVPVFHNL